MDDYQTAAQQLFLSQGVETSIEDRLACVEAVLMEMLSPECCGEPAHYNQGTGQFVCKSCLMTVGNV